MCHAKKENRDSGKCKPCCFLKNKSRSRSAVKMKATYGLVAVLLLVCHTFTVFVSCLSSEKLAPNFHKWPRKVDPKTGEKEW